MATIGAHVLLYTSEPEAVRSILRDVFGWRHVDAGKGWLIFALPPAEVGTPMLDVKSTSPSCLTVGTPRTEGRRWQPCTNPARQSSGRIEKIWI